MKYLTVEEVRDLGVLLETNRQLLHPRGLALESYIVTEPQRESIHTIIWRRSAVEWLRDLVKWAHAQKPTDWSEESVTGLLAYLDDVLAQPDAGILRVQDHRDDPEGVYYDDLDAQDVEKAKRFEALSKTAGRVEALGFFVQPL